MILVTWFELLFLFAANIINSEKGGGATSNLVLVRRVDARVVHNCARATPSLLFDSSCWWPLLSPNRILTRNCRASPSLSPQLASSVALLELRTCLSDNNYIRVKQYLVFQIYIYIYISTPLYDDRNQVIIIRTNPYRNHQTETSNPRNIVKFIIPQIYP